MNYDIMIDILPFMIATAIVLWGTSKVSFKKPLSIAIVFTTCVFMLAQSSWFSAWMSGNEWGRDWANYVWFVFNTLTMVIFACQLFLVQKKS